MKKSYFLIAIGMVLGVIFLLPFIILGILNMGNAAGLLLALILFIYGVFFEKINCKIKNLWKKRLWKILFSAFSLILAICIVFVGFATYNIICAANNYPEEETTVVVLGCKVNPNGPSLTLLTRLEAAYDYLSKNPEAKCILSGGQGDDEHLSEAQAMYNWLTEKGIDGKRLYIEDRSTSTWENLSFSKEIIEKENLPSAITIITSEFHQYRAQEIAERYGMKAYGISGKSPLYLLPAYYVRELGGILVEFCF